jgi:putative membrane protein
MARDQAAVNKQALALPDKLKVKPEDNDTSKSLIESASKKRDELSKLSGAAFGWFFGRQPTCERPVTGSM